MGQPLQVPPGFEVNYRVEWLYASSPQLDRTAIQDELATVLPESLVEDATGGGLSIIHKGHAVKFADGEGKAITAVVVAHDRPISQKEFEAAVQQTWTWPREDAIGRIARSRVRLVIMDLMSLGQPYKTRLGLVHEVARAVARTTRPEVGYWHPAGWMVAPENVTTDPLDTAMNVRLFNVDGPDGPHVMDTLGLGAIGVPDIQCHFKDLEAGRIAGLLQNLGRYVFEKGDVIEDGHTVQGHEPTDKWKCRHEWAIVEPRRIVIDVNPGPPFSPR
jgi:hypothetical protein